LLVIVFLISLDASERCATGRSPAPGVGVARTATMPQWRCENAEEGWRALVAGDGYAQSASGASDPPWSPSWTLWLSGAPGKSGALTAVSSFRPGSSWGGVAVVAVSLLG
jgi:hypothetical protein